MCTVSELRKHIAASKNLGVFCKDGARRALLFLNNMPDDAEVTPALIEQARQSGVQVAVMYRLPVFIEGYTEYADCHTDDPPSEMTLRGNTVTVVAMKGPITVRGYGRLHFVCAILHTLTVVGEGVAVTGILEAERGNVNRGWSK